MPLMPASSAFAPGGQIPTEYTCDGADISPPLSWSGVPPGTRSLILVVEDPDAPSRVFRYWAGYDIPRGRAVSPSAMAATSRPLGFAMRATISGAGITAVLAHHRSGLGRTTTTFVCGRSPGGRSI